MSRHPTSTTPDLSNHPGLRSAEAFIRPTPISTHGDVLTYAFDLKSATFTFTLHAPSSCPEDAPSEIYLPHFHFPSSSNSGGNETLDVRVTDGKWRVETLDVDGEGMQWVKWWHGAGEQKMTIKGTVRKTGITRNDHGEDFGYFDSLARVAANCVIM